MVALRKWFGLSVFTRLYFLEEARLIRVKLFSS